MKLLIILVFISSFPTYVYAKDYYLVSGTSLQLSSPRRSSEKVIAFTLSSGGGVILKKKYDLSFLLKYGKKLEEKFYGAGISSKYLLRTFDKSSKINPYIGVFVGFNKGNQFSSEFSISVGNRFFNTPNMAMVLNLEYGKSLSNKEEVTSLRSLISWSYFF